MGSHGFWEERMANVKAEWSKDEDRILREVYPEHGTSETMKALRAAGYERSVGAIKMHAKLLGIRYAPKMTQRVGPMSDVTGIATGSVIHQMATSVMIARSLCASGESPSIWVK